MARMTGRNFAFANTSQGKLLGSLGLTPRRDTYIYEHSKATILKHLYQDTKKDRLVARERLDISKS